MVLNSMRSSSTGFCDGGKNKAVVDDLFERWAWLYAVCRERVFTDHTKLIAKVMQDRFPTAQNPVFMELGCGPGFYSIRLARQFPEWRVVGMDKSLGLLKRAESKVATNLIANCSFCCGDATCPSDFPEQADLLLASRLFLILPDRFLALCSMYQALRDGGTLLIAEPLPGWRSRLALIAMRLLRSFGTRNSYPAGDAPSTKPLAAGELSSFVQCLRWAQIQSWSDNRYQYVLCEKPAAENTNRLDVYTTGSSRIPTEFSDHDVQRNCA